MATAATITKTATQVSMFHPSARKGLVQLVRAGAARLAYFRPMLGAVAGPHHKRQRKPATACASDYYDLADSRRYASRPASTAAEIESFLRTATSLLRSISSSARS